MRIRGVAKTLHLEKTFDRSLIDKEDGKREMIIAWQKTIEENGDKSWGEKIIICLKSRKETNVSLSKARKATWWEQYESQFEEVLATKKNPSRQLGITKT